MSFKMATYRGKFKPRNPGKYRGNPGNIVYRSSWELKLMLHLDAHQDVVWWCSEEVAIPYRSPVDGKVHRYFPDFIANVKKPTGVMETMMIEVKPLKQSIEPKKQKKVTRQYLREVFTYGINTEKWKAAKEYCADRGWTFHVFTEKELDIRF